MISKAKFRLCTTPQYYKRKRSSPWPRTSLVREGWAALASELLTVLYSSALEFLYQSIMSRLNLGQAFRKSIMPNNFSML